MPVIDHVALDGDGRIYCCGISYGKDRVRKNNRGLEIWELTGPKLVVRHFPKHIVNGFRLNPRGRWLYASAEPTVRHAEENSGYFTVDLQSGTETWLEQRAWQTCKLVVDPDGRWLLGFSSGSYASSTRIVR